MSNFNFGMTDVASRETRIGSLTAYKGSLSELASLTDSGEVSNCDRCFSQSGGCPSMCALGQIARIRDVLVVHHGPAGCSIQGVATNTIVKQLAKKRGIKNNTVYIGTDMNEEDTIFGAEGKLKDIVRTAYERYRPKAIFVSSSCASGIIGEDIDSVVEDLREEIDVPIAPVHCEGFKSHIQATGFDLSDHAVLTTIVKPPEGKRNVINFKNFFESARLEIIDIFKNFDVEPLFFYTNATVEELSHMSESLATVSVCGSLGNYIGNALEELYGVPYVRSINMLGIEGFETWLRTIGRTIGREEKIEAYLKAEREKYMPKIEELKKELKGLRAVIGMGPGYTFEVARVLNELGMEVVWGAAWHYDKQFEDRAAKPEPMQNLIDKGIDFEMSVSDQQNYELLNILEATKPDIYISRHNGTTVWAVKQGYAALFAGDEFMIFGYKGTLNFAQAVLDTIKNRSFEKNLAKRTKVPYTDWWYKQNMDKFFVGGNKKEGR